MSMEANISANITSPQLNPEQIDAATTNRLERAKKPERILRSQHPAPEQKQTVFNSFLFQQKANRLINIRQKYGAI